VFLILGRMSGARLASVGLPLRTIGGLSSDQSLEGLLVNSLVHIAAIAAGDLQDGLTIPVYDLVPPDTVLRPSQVCTVAG
jgi:hypothetical protein